MSTAIIRYLNLRKWNYLEEVNVIIVTKSIRRIESETKRGVENNRSRYFDAQLLFLTFSKRTSP